jgi:hypothetical protein
MQTAAQIQITPSLLATNPSIGKDVLNSYLGKSVEEFCTKYNDHNDNHCAHFVGHVLGLQFQHCALCSNVGLSIKYAERATGYCIRVDQIFKQCANRGYWDDKKNEDVCFVVATIASVIDSESSITLNNGPNKHIGILLDGRVYNYSNSHDQVVAKSIHEFKRHYGANTILLRADLPS